MSTAAVISRDRELAAVAALWLGDAGIRTEVFPTAEEAASSDAELFITDGGAPEGKKALFIVSENEAAGAVGLTLLRPFSQTELLTAARALLSGAPKELYCDGEKMRAVCRGASVSLTKKELLLLQLLLERGARGVTLSEASAIARRGGGSAETNAANVYIHRLRRKLMELTGEPVIKTVRGRGYVIE